MAVTKGTGTTLLAAVTSTTTSSAVSAAGDYATEIAISYAQNGTVATVGGQVQISWSPDGGTTYYAPANLLFVAPLTASLTTNPPAYLLPVSTTMYKATYTQPTGGTGTCTVQSNDVTGI